MLLLLSTLGVGLVSAVLPVVNLEIYLGVVATQLDGPSGALTVSLAAAAGLGQGLGKFVWYLVAARSLESAWVQRKLAKGSWRLRYDTWRARIAGRPWLTVGVLLTSSVLGMPPLLVIAVVAGSLRVPVALFLPTVIVGRAVRFWCVLTGVGFMVG